MVSVHGGKPDLLKFRSCKNEKKKEIFSFFQWLGDRKPG